MTNNPFDALISRVNDYAKRVVSATARIARDDIVDAYKASIDMFYSDYSPVSYKRHHGLYSGYRQIYTNPHGLIAYAGIEFAPDNMPSVYQDGPEMVLYTSLMGFHGYVARTRPPIEYLEMQLETIVACAQSYVDAGVAAAGGL